MEEWFNNYPASFNDAEIQSKVAVVGNNSHQYNTVDNLKLLFNIIDLTSLNTEDNYNKIKEFVFKVNELEKHFEEVPDVAAICVYPSMVECVKENLTAPNVKIASVAGGFPSSQTFTDIKIEECKKAIEKGASEIDIVLPVGHFLEKDYEFCFNEIKSIKKAIKDTHLKVILESGTYETLQDVWNASILAMEAGADFIKTSTGKQQPAATLEAVYVMTKAIAEFYSKTGKKTGIKPAGGISTAEDALAYFAIVKENLGDEWLNNNLFRIGASRLANHLLSGIYKKEVSYF